MEQAQETNRQLPDFNSELLGGNLPVNNVLFYPCSGNDIVDAIFYFYPIVDTFFFCDVTRISNIAGTDRKIKEKLPDLDLSKSVEECLWEKNTDERPRRRRDVNGREQIIEPPLYRTKTTKLTRIWRNEKESKEITIIRVVGDGYNVFSSDEILKEIGIFFYRGDSYGEGGSDVRWLETENDRDRCYDGRGGKHFDVVLQKIANKGLIVTDGSNCGDEYNFLRQYHEKTVTKGTNTFKCIGKITPRRGSTLVWQIEKNSACSVG